MSHTLHHHLQPAEDAMPLRRRGFDLGYVVPHDVRTVPMTDAQVARAWQQDRAVWLPGMLDVQRMQAEIAQAHRLMAQVLAHGEVTPMIDQSPYTAALQPEFSLVAASFEEHDEQAIEKLYFDAMQGGDCVAEDLWCKASWLSFLEDDASLRFRFSFGMEALEDVAADPVRQRWAGTLCDRLFPESALLTEHAVLRTMLAQAIGGEPMFVERIVYFNAPNGGAQMHHDVERGHDGVVFAQLSGRTFWLALAKPLLIDELIAFITDPAQQPELSRLLPAAEDRAALMALAADRAALADYMDAFDHELVEAVMDRSAAFVQQLVNHGYGYLLHAGDLLLMPQRNLEQCVWHSVITLGDEPGEALSFAVRPAG